MDVIVQELCICGYYFDDFDDTRQGRGLIVKRFFLYHHTYGTTIIQVTHSEQNARYGSRIIHLLDGSIEREEHL